MRQSGHPHASMNTMPERVPITAASRLPQTFSKMREVVLTASLHNDRTQRCGRHKAFESATDVARPHSLPGRRRDCSRRPPRTRT